jgi:DNA-binding transcriptional LysR family regulator
MELRQLRYFIAVAEEGHITRAAERLNIQQPPLSRLIKSIEKELDVQLFRRKPRGVELTEAGRAFLDKTRAALANIEQAAVGVKRAARGEQGRISVGIVHTAAFLLPTPTIIDAFRQAFPLVSVTLRESSTGELSEDVRQERADVAFLRSPPANSEGLHIDHLFDEPLVVAIPGGHPLATTKPSRKLLSLKVFAEESFVIQGRQSGAPLYTATITACHAAGFRPKVGQEVSRFTSALAYVAAGLGVALVPSCLQRLQMDGVLYRRLAHAPTLPLVLVSRRSDPSVVTRNFVKLARNQWKDFSDKQAR